MTIEEFSYYFHSSFRWNLPYSHICSQWQGHNMFHYSDRGLVDSHQYLRKTKPFAYKGSTQKNYMYMYIKIYVYPKWILSMNNFVCLEVSVPLENFQSYRDYNITGEWLKILTYVWHLWPLSSDGSLACNTCYGTDHPFIMVISEDPRQLQLMPSIWQWSCHCLF